MWNAINQVQDLNSCHLDVIAVEKGAFGSLAIKVANFYLIEINVMVQLGYQLPNLPCGDYLKYL